MKYFIVNTVTPTNIPKGFETVSAASAFADTLTTGQFMIYAMRAAGVSYIPHQSDAVSANA